MVKNLSPSGTRLDASNARGHEYLLGLVRELTELSAETEYVEFKVGNADPQMIGENISALSNSALLSGQPRAYVVWGVEDQTHKVIGTEFLPSSAKKGNEPLEAWLLRLLKPQISFSFHEVTTEEGRRIVLLEISPASQLPVAFGGVEYIRVGSSTRKLKDFHEKERSLWETLGRNKFESNIAAERVMPDEILATLDFDSFFKLMEIPQPDGHEAIIAKLEHSNLISKYDFSKYNITNLGAILFADDLSSFSHLKSKAIRVIRYGGTGKTSAKSEKEFAKGYASVFEEIVSYIDALSPKMESIDKAVRHQHSDFPVLAIRELVANALIHQDFSEQGSGPIIELFEGRIEISNPGKPLIPIDRFIDETATPRNNEVAYQMRKLKLCEERGSGIDKVVEEIEKNQLPAPLFEETTNSTRVVLFERRSLLDMDKPERLRACYQHACLQYVARKNMTNKSLRERFGVSEKNTSLVSNLLNEAVAEGLIALENPDVGKRSRRYIPHWAASQGESALFHTKPPK